MPPRRRSNSGYHGVRARPSGIFSAEIRSRDDRINLGLYPTAIEAARAYDAAAWRLGRPRGQMNVPNVRDAQELEDRASTPRLVTDEDRRHHRHRAMQGLVAERDERAVSDWYVSHPREAREEAEFWNTCAAERAEWWAERHEWREERREAKAAAQSELPTADSWAVDDPRWAALTEDIGRRRLYV